MSKMTGEELVRFCRSKIGTPYVFGMDGTVLTHEKYNDLKKRYTNYVWNSDAQKIGKMCVDCSGLLQWATGIDKTSYAWYDEATKKENITSITEAPIGALVWKKGHIGVYSGKKNGVAHYIAADGSQYGVREVPLSQSQFTHWLLDENAFSYEEDEMVVKDKIIVNETEYEVSMIRKDGVTYIKTRDIANALGMAVSNKGRIPVLEK